MSEKFEMPKIDWDKMVDRASVPWKKVKIFTSSFRTPSDAATARMTEEDPPRLYVPPEYQIKIEIHRAKVMEANAQIQGISAESKAMYWGHAACHRTKAISLHLGIEKVNW